MELDDAKCATASAGDVAVDERQLLKVFQQSRLPEDFEPLIQCSLDKVRGVIYRIVLNQDELEDLVQDAYLKAYQKFDSFRGGSAFSTWVCQIAVNHTLNYVRKRKRVVQADDYVFENRTSPQSERPDNQAIKNEHRERVDQAIAKLPEHLRIALVLSVVEKMDTAEVAKVCGCNKATVYWRLHKARKVLKKLMNETGD